MRRSYEFEIDGLKYIATTLPGKKGMSCVTRLLLLFGPSITAAFKGTDLKKMTIADSAFAEVAKTIISNIDFLLN